jgi:hypothetical protein
MSNETTRPTSGQETDPSINPHSDLAKILEAIGKLATSITILEQRFEYLDRDCLKAIKAASLPVPEHLIEERQATEDDEPDTDPEPHPLAPALGEGRAAPRDDRAEPRRAAEGEAGSTQPEGSLRDVGLPR